MIQPNLAADSWEFSAALSPLHTCRLMWFFSHSSQLSWTITVTGLEVEQAWGWLVRWYSTADSSGTRDGQYVGESGVVICGYNGLPSIHPDAGAVMQAAS